MQYLAKFTLIGLVLLLTACFDFLDDEDDSNAAPSPDIDLVTSDNISEAIQLTGATSVDTPVTVPNSLTPTTSSNVNSVVVSANSSFSIDLSVDQADVPTGKKVGGYMVELPSGDQFFVVASSDSGERTILQLPTTRTNLQSFKKTKNISARDFSPSSRVLTYGNTEITIAGWSSLDFNLEDNIDNLKLRIYPLLVNASVNQITNIDDIDLTDPDNWVGLQELALAVVAVATNPVQISLTWDAVTDLDLWIIEPNSHKIYYADKISASSMGWLDFDNVEAYGPENITFAYQMPEGDYQVYVHHFDGYVEANYQVTVAVDDIVNTHKGSFASTVSGSEDIGSDSVDLITTITVDANLNTKLKAVEALVNHAGIWKPQGAPLEDGFIEITENSISVYISHSVYGCLGFPVLEGSNLPTGIITDNGQLKVSEAFIGGFDFESDDFTYKYLTLETTSKPTECVEYNGQFDD